MITFNQISIVLGLICLIIIVESSSSITVTFPTLSRYEINTPYNMEIENNVDFPKEHFVFSFEIVNKNTGDIVSTIAVTSSDFTGEVSRGFAIKNFTIKSSRIEMKLIFGKDSYQTTLTIRYGIEPLETDKETFFNDKRKGVIFERFIDLRSIYTINLSARPALSVLDSEDRLIKDFQLLPNKLGQVTCQIDDATQPVDLRFSNQEALKDVIVKKMSDKAIRLEWTVLIEDHGKSIECHAADSAKNVTLNVYHYVSEALASPPIHNKISRNSQVKCISKDGYPVPKTTWVFLSGPLDAWKSYQLRDNNVTLFINSSAPVNSNWSFECRSYNEMPEFVLKYMGESRPIYPMRKLLNFTIIDANDSVKTSQAGIIFVIIFLVIILVILIVLCIKYREKIEIFLSDRFPQVFKTEKELGKSSKMPATRYQYAEMNKNESQLNGAEETPYADIIGAIQKKDMRDPSLGPIDRV